MRRLLLVALILAAGAGAGYAIGQRDSEEGPDNRVQASGRQLNPVGTRTALGNLPTGRALTPNGRFLWTTSAGRGRNDVRIVRVAPSKRCRRARAENPRTTQQARRRLKRCRRRVARQVGRLVQTIPMPGPSAGIAMAPDGHTAYVSVIPEPSREVIHVLRYDPRTGAATRDGVINVPPPTGAPVVQDLPSSTAKRSAG